jgi:shikimate kinase
MQRPYDYYDYTPLVVPDRPIAVAGAPGAGVQRTARLISILTGLPLALLDRQVEHRAGTDLSRLVAAPGGRQRRRTHEAELLRRALSMRTPPIIALGDDTLLDAGLRWLVTERARVVHLRTTLEECVRELERTRVEEPSRHAHVLFGRPPDRTALRGPHAELTALLDRLAEVSVDVVARHPTRVARELVQLLDLDTDPA